MRHMLAVACLVLLAGTVSAHAQGAGRIVRDCPTCPEMVQIPAGSFTMGVPAAEEEREKVPQQFRNSFESQHRVTIPRALLMGRYAVTRGEFAAFVSDTNYQRVGGCLTYDKDKDGKYVWTEKAERNWRSPGFRQTDRDPAVCVSATDADAYVAWLSRKTGQSYRLPSEAEWEYAARAGTTTARFWGDDRGSACRYANVADLTRMTAGNFVSDPDIFFQCSDGFAFTAPVGSFQPNGFGLYDMLGNAGQWTSDCWNANYSGAPSDGTAWKIGDCGRRVPRGGSWGDGPRDVRAGMRDHLGVGDRLNDTGFRVSRTL
jgi:sulfatase modifying factor 1